MGAGAAGLALPPGLSGNAKTAEAAPASAARPDIPSHLTAYEALYRKEPHAAALRWFREARYGMMVCYSLCSLDGIHYFEQWQYRIPVREYEKKAQRFAAKGFDAGAIADLAQSAGMKYVTMIAKFCEGFCLWDTKQTAFNTVRTASRRDLIADMAEACRKRGLGLFFFYEHGFEWHHPHGPRRKDWKSSLVEVPYATPEPTYAQGDQYDLNKYVDFVFAQITELLTQYGPVAGVWLDGWAVPSSGDSSRFRLPELYAQIRRLQPHALISYKWGITGSEDFLALEASWIDKGLKQAGDVVDRGATGGRLAKAKQEGTAVEICDSLLPGWLFRKGVKPQGVNYALKHLELARSIKANYLLNIALLPDGSLNPEEAKTLQTINEVIRANGLLSY